MTSNAITLPQKVTRLVRNNLALLQPCWIFWITSSFCMYLNIASRTICSITFPDAEVSLTALQFPESSFFPFIKLRVMFTLFQSQGTSSCRQLFEYDRVPWQSHHSVPSGSGIRGFRPHTLVQVQSHQVVFILHFYSFWCL